jgi:hypothetical protein
MKSLCIHHHLGLGDHFDCNGMVRYILKESEFDEVHIFSKHQYWEMIEYMYRDNDKIIVVKIDGNKDEYEQVAEYANSGKCSHFLRVGHEFYPFEEEEKYDKNCWEFFYDQVKIPYEVRTDMFYVERDTKEEERVLSKLNPNNEKFIFVHDDESRGFKVDRKHILNPDLLVIENDITENALHFFLILEKAEEIHCMESSFKSLIDLYAQTDHIFYHDFRNQPLGNYTTKKWSIIKYD